MINKFKDIIIILLILLSGSVFFTIKYGKEFKMIFIIMVMICILFNFNKVKYNIKSVSIIILFIILNNIINRENNLSAISTSALIFLLILVAMFQNFMTKKEFKEKYIIAIYYISVISLFCYSLDKLNIITLFLFKKQEIIGNSSFIYSFYYTWGWSSSFDRNAGLFWEPGAFQAFINIALMMILFSNDIKISGLKNKYSIILLITLLTTYSTTGYIVFIIMFAYKVFFNNYKNIKGIFLIPITFVVCISILLTSRVIVDKFSRENVSGNIRLKDTIVTLEMIKERPFFGNGYGSKDQIDNFKNNGIINNSNGFLKFTYEFGIIIACIFLIMYIKSIKSLFEISTLKAVSLLLIFIILFSTEALMIYPLFFTFLFRWDEKKLQ